MVGEIGFQERPVNWEKGKQAESIGKRDSLAEVSDQLTKLLPSTTVPKPRFASEPQPNDVGDAAVALTPEDQAKTGLRALAKDPNIVNQQNDTSKNVQQLSSNLGDNQGHIANEGNVKQLYCALGGSDPEIVDGQTVITKSTTTGHPHLNEPTNTAVQSYFNHEPKEVNKEAETTLAQEFNSKFSDENGNIDFKAVIEKYNQDPTTNPKLDPKAFKKAGIKGKVFLKEDGSFDFKISGKCSDEAVQCMTALKKELEDIKTSQTPPLDVPININPATVGPLSDEDKMTLARGGQIQYRPLPNGEIMKLTLDPGCGGQDDGLAISIYKPDQNNALGSPSSHMKIPLSVVFEGGELNGKKVGPFLQNWRNQQLFEKSVIHEQRNLSDTKTRQTNEDDVGRIQAQNDLWNAVNKYLKASVEITEGHFGTTNDKDLQTEKQKNKTDPANVSNEPKTENESANTENITGGFTAGSNSTESILVDESESNVEENSQQQAPNSASNISVDIEEKAIVSKQQGEIYSNKLQELSQKAKTGNLTTTDIKNFQTTLPQHAQDYLKEYLKSNNINFMLMNELNTLFAKLDKTTCDKMGQAIAQANTSQNPKSIQTESKSIEYNQALNINQVIDNSNKETTEDLAIRHPVKV